MYDTDKKTNVSMKRLDVGVHCFDKFVKRSPERSIYHKDLHTESYD